MWSLKAVFLGFGFFWVAKSSGSGKNFSRTLNFEVRKRALPSDFAPLSLSLQRTSNTSANKNLNL